MSVSRQARAAALLDVAQRTARGRLPDSDDDEPEGVENANRALIHIQKQVAYLSAQAPAAWKPEFRKALELAHSIRTVGIERVEKCAGRVIPTKCDACGRDEDACTVAVDMVGGNPDVFDAKEWTRCRVPCESLPSGSKSIATLWDAFHNGYTDGWQSFEGYTSTEGPPASAAALPVPDMGRWYIGKTCLRKLKLTYQCHTLILDLVYEAMRVLESGEYSMTNDPWIDAGCVQCGARTTDGDSSITQPTVDPSTLYCAKCHTYTSKPYQPVVSNALTSAEEFVKRKDALELAIADDAFPAPQLCTDAILWQHVDEWRRWCPSTALCERKEWWLRSGGQRCKSHGNSGVSDEDSEDNEDSSQSGKEEEEWHGGVKDFVLSSDQEGSEECGVYNGERRSRSNPPAQSRHQPRAQQSVAARRRVVQDSDDEDVQDDTGKDNHPVSARVRSKRPLGAKPRKQTCKPTRQLKRQRGVLPDEGTKGWNSRRGAPTAPDASEGDTNSGQHSDSGNAQLQDVLPCSRVALSDLMEVQARLFANGQDRDAAILSAAVVHYQRLLQKADASLHLPDGLGH